VLPLLLLLLLLLLLAAAGLPFISLLPILFRL
jgi:hypothetical protein